MKNVEDLKSLWHEQPFMKELWDVIYDTLVESFVEEEFPFGFSVSRDAALIFIGLTAEKVGQRSREIHGTDPWISSLAVLAAQVCDPDYEAKIVQLVAKMSNRNNEALRVH